MDGSRGIRAQGIEGKDHAHRQQIDNRYQQLSSAKSFISTTSLISLMVGFYTVVGAFVDPHVFGVDFGLGPPITLTLLTVVLYLLSSQVSSSVVDTGVVALHKLLCNLLFFGAVVVLGSLAYEFVVKANFTSYFMYPSVLLYLFLALISHRTTQADNEIIESLETKKKGGKKN